jgi:hypothetical protein
VSQPAFTEADLAYIRANFVTLGELAASRGEPPAELRARIESGLAPRACYVLDDGTEMFSPNWLPIERDEFDRRYLAAGGDPSELDEDWAHHLNGTYGLCVREPTPENIVRKEQLVRSIGSLLDEPRPGDAQWRERLRAEVDELDALECDFSPDYDRSGRLGGPPSRDRLIKAARERYKDAFEPTRV